MINFKNKNLQRILFTLSEDLETVVMVPDILLIN